MQRPLGAAHQDALQGAQRSTGSDTDLLALADVDKAGGRTVVDSGARLTSTLLAYGVAAVRARLPELSFLWHLDGGERVRVRISPTRPGAEPRELRVEIPGETYDLTRRELQVLTLMCGGLTNQEIARSLGSSVRTVTTQVARVLMKLDQPARAGAVALAVDQQLLCLPIHGSVERLGRLAVGRLECAVRGNDIFVPPPVARQLVRPSPLRIGQLVPAAFLNEGSDMSQGGLLAAEQVNARGGIHGRLLELVTVSSDVFDITTLPASLETLGPRA